MESSLARYGHSPNQFREAVSASAFLFSMKVLLADDDEDQLAIREMLVAHSGFETLTASDAHSALRAAIISRPACAIVDLRFPTEELGLRLIRGLKKIDGQMRILVLTGNPDALLRKPERALVEDVIQKGEPSGNLIRKLKNMATAIKKSAVAQPY